MEDRYYISVDVGDGKDWWYVHGLSTHDKVYGVNRQMCDLGKTTNDPMKPLSEEAIQEIAKALEITRKPKGIMEEKKTRKMTKAEAFEYLKGKKVLCYSSKMEVVQGFVKSLGFHWSDYSEEPMLVSILFLGEDGRLTYSVSLKRFEEHESPEISADDILSIEIVEDNRSEDELVEIVELGKQIQYWLSKLSGHRHVVITEDDVILYDEGMSLFHSDPF